MDIKIIYEDNDVLVVDKPAGIVVFEEHPANGSHWEGPSMSRLTLINILIEKYPELKNAGEAPRYGIVHRLDKDTSGVLLVAKSTEALLFLQKQFKNKTNAVLSASLGNKNSDSGSLALLNNRTVEKKYVCLVEGTIKEDKGEIKTLVARSPKDGRKQKVYLENEPHPKSAREAITEYKVLKDFKDYTFLEVEIKTGRRHQIRCHFSYLQHPIAGDKLYSFKNSKSPKGLTRQFLHAQKLKIQLPNGKTEEFKSDLPEDLQNILDKLKNF
jgi:23S rRNA pseudouridine1911/1915/1917 synthase